MIHRPFKHLQAAPILMVLCISIWTDDTLGQSCGNCIMQQKSSSSGGSKFGFAGPTPGPAHYFLHQKTVWTQSANDYYFIENPPEPGVAGGNYKLCSNIKDTFDKYCDLDNHYSNSEELKKHSYLLDGYYEYTWDESYSAIDGVEDGNWSAETKHLDASYIPMSDSSGSGSLDEPIPDEFRDMGSYPCGEVESYNSTPYSISITYAYDGDWGWPGLPGSIDESGSEMITFSEPFTDEMLKKIMTDSLADFSGDWITGCGKTAYYILDGPHDGGYCGKMEYQILILDSQEGVTYNVEWQEVTTSIDDGSSSSVKKTCQIMGTGDPASPAIYGPIVVDMPGDADTRISETAPVIVPQSAADNVAAGDDMN